MNVDVVIPTIGRPSLVRLLDALAGGAGPRPNRLIVVDDRRARSSALAITQPARALSLSVLAAGGRGPAAARNIGWRASAAEWVVFLDDDVVPAADWLRCLRADIEAVRRDRRAGASQGRIEVPLPRNRRPTDWERDVAGLACARFITADIAYRRAALERVGGFDEYFEAAYREDADLAVRVRAAGYEIRTGTRRVSHPVRPAGRWISVRRQRGNAADARMRRKHGRNWRAAALAPRGRFAAHGVVVAAFLVVAVASAAGAWRVAVTAFGVWATGTAQFAWARLRPGPWHRREISTVLVTSALIPFAAVIHRLRGEWRERRRVRAVLFDRDGTLVVDVPYNGDPERVQPVEGAALALARLRAHGVRAAVVSNQSGIARGLLSRDQAERVNRRIDERIGPFDGWWLCPHGDGDGCECRKPAPGMLLSAARALGVPIERCVLIGDTQADLDAAAHAGCGGILVPNAATRNEEVAAAPRVAPDLASAVDVALGIRR